MQVDILKVKLPTKTPHGTLFIEGQQDLTKYVLVAPDGTELVTQRTKVLSFKDGEVIELTGWSWTPVSGDIKVEKLDKPDTRKLGLSLFDSRVVGMLLGFESIQIQVDDNPPVDLVGSAWPFTHRVGPTRITLGKEIDLGDFKAVVWADIRAGSTQVAFTITIHNCDVPCKPDAYFNKIKLIFPDDYKMAPMITDGAMDAANNLLVKPDPRGTHVIPRLYRRPFRFSLIPKDASLEYDGWGTTRWNRIPESGETHARIGGFLPHSISVPDLSHTSPNYAAENALASDALLTGKPDPTYGGALAPPALLWPTSGIAYGGGTS